MERVPRPLSLSRTCVELVADGLAKGCMTWLARSGGWRRERFLRDGQPRTGSTLGAVGAGHAGSGVLTAFVEFLVWITAHRPGPEAAAGVRLLKLTRRPLLLFLAYDLLRDTEADAALRAVPATATTG